MKVTPIIRCANIECPNKPHEGTFTVATFQTPEDRPLDFQRNTVDDSWVAL